MTPAGEKRFVGRLVRNAVVIGVSDEDISPAGECWLVDDVSNSATVIAELVRKGAAVLDESPVYRVFPPCSDARIPDRTDVIVKIRASVAKGGHGGRFEYARILKRAGILRDFGGWEQTHPQPEIIAGQQTAPHVLCAVDEWLDSLRARAATQAAKRKADVLALQSLEANLAAAAAEEARRLADVAAARAAKIKAIVERTATPEQAEEELKTRRFALHGAIAAKDSAKIAAAEASLADGERLLDEARARASGADFLNKKNARSERLQRFLPDRNTRTQDDWSEVRAAHMTAAKALASAESDDDLVIVDALIDTCLDSWDRLQRPKRTVNVDDNSPFNVSQIRFCGGPVELP